MAGMGWVALRTHAFKQAQVLGNAQALPYLQRPLQLCKGLLPLLLRCASCCASLAPAWMLTGLAIRLGGLFRRRRATAGQCIGEEARIKEKLQHALLCDCTVQGASQLQRLPATAFKA